MNDAVETGVAVIADTVAGVPASVRRPFFKAVGHLLGNLTSIPAVMARRPVQAIEDVTSGRQVVASALAKGVAERAINDPAIMKAAEEIFLPDIVRKATNRIRTVQEAAEHIAENSKDDDVAGEPDEDWLNAFARFADDASSDRLQSLFGRILAGEIVAPGSFSLRTLRAVSELDQGVANDFMIAWSKSVGDSVDYSDEWQRGEEFLRWRRLAEAGLMANSQIATFLPSTSPLANELTPWTPMKIGDAWVTIYFEPGCTARWLHIEFTRVGQELGSVLAKPDYDANMRRAAARMPMDKIASVLLRRSDGTNEVLRHQQK